MKTNSGRIFQYDLMRAVAIIAVVMTHSMTKFYHTPLEISISQWLNTFMRASIPVFLFLAGLFFHYKADFNYLKQKFIRVLVPYTIFFIPSTIYIFAQQQHTLTDWSWL